MTKKKQGPTAGEASIKASSDSTKYDALEVGYALSEDVLEQLRICAAHHCRVIDEPEFCVVMVIADDPLIKNVMRRKFYAWPYLPSPRPRQSVFLYNKAQDKFTRLWVLPEAFAMSALSTLVTVDKPWRTMKAWSDAFFSGNFWEVIRKQHNISMLSEHEYLEANRQKLIEAGCQYLKPSSPNPLDFAKIATEKVINSKTTLPDENSLQGFGKT